MVLGARQTATRPGRVQWPLALAAVLVHLLVILALQSDAAIVAQEQRERARHLGGGAAEAGTWWVASYDLGQSPLTVVSDWSVGVGAPQATGPPAGLAAHPAEGEVFVSEGLRRELARDGPRAALLEAFVDGEVVGELGDRMVVHPGEFVAVVGRDPATTTQPIPVTVGVDGPFSTSTPPRAGFAVFWLLLLSVAAACVAATARLDPLAWPSPGGAGRARGRRGVALGLVAGASAAAWLLVLVGQPLPRAGSLIGLAVFPSDVALDPLRLAAAFVVPQAVVAAAARAAAVRGGLPAVYGSRRSGLVGAAARAAGLPLLALGATAFAFLPDAVAGGLQVAALLCLVAAGGGWLTSSVRAAGTWAERSRVRGRTASLAARGVRRDAAWIAGAGAGCAASMLVVGLLLSVEPDASTPTDAFAPVHVLVEGPDADADLARRLAAIPGVEEVGSFGVALAPTEGPSPVVVDCADAVAWLGVDPGACAPGQYRDGPSPADGATARLMLFGMTGPLEIEAERVAETAEAAAARGWPLLTVDERVVRDLGARSLVVRTDDTPQALAAVGGLLSRDAPTAAISTPSDAPSTPGLASARRGALVTAVVSVVVTLVALVAVVVARARRDAPLTRALSMLGATAEPTRRADAFETLVAAAAVTLPPLALGGVVGSLVRATATGASRPVAWLTLLALAAVTASVSLYRRRRRTRAIASRGEPGAPQAAGVAVPEAPLDAAPRRP